MAYSTTSTAATPSWPLIEPYHGRSLNESIENAKNKANETYTGMKRTVQDNMVISIILSVTVLSLLILCCYLRRKYSRNAQVVTRREYNQLLKTREERERHTSERRGMENQQVNRSRGGDQDTDYREKPFKDNGRRRRRKKELHEAEEDPTLFQNSSMETSGTVLSNEEINFVDVENGQGFEVEDASPIKKSPDTEDSHQVESAQGELDLDDEQSGDHTSPKKEKKSLFSRRR